MSEKYQIHEAANGAWFVGKHNSGCAYSAKQIYDALDKVGREVVVGMGEIKIEDGMCRSTAYGCHFYDSEGCCLKLMNDSVKVVHGTPSPKCPGAGTYEVVLRKVVQDD